MFFLPLFFLNALGQACGQASVGQPPLQENFNITRFMGRWYEIYRPLNVTFQFGTDAFADYAVNREDNSLVINMTQWVVGANYWLKFNGKGRQSNPLEPAQWEVFFGNASDDYRILYTDYENIAAVYSERELPTPAKTGWIFGRIQRPPVVPLGMAFAYLARREISRSDMYKTEHGRAPKFGGRVQNFDYSKLAFGPNYNPVVPTTSTSTTKKPKRHQVQFPWNFLTSWNQPNWGFQYQPAVQLPRMNLNWPFQFPNWGFN